MVEMTDEQAARDIRTWFNGLRDALNDANERGFSVACVNDIFDYPDLARHVVKHADTTLEITRTVKL